MKYVLFMGLILMALPSFAQRANLYQRCFQEEDVTIGTVSDMINERRERVRVIALLECRSGVYDFLSSDKARRFLEAHRGDVTFATRMYALSGCEFEECLAVTREHDEVSLYADFSNDEHGRFLGYFADKYRQWLNTNNNQEDRQTNEEASSDLKKCEPAQWLNDNRGRLVCGLWRCEGIRGRIALEPSRLEVKGVFTVCGIAGCDDVERLERLEGMTLYGPDDFQKLGGNLRFIFVPGGVAYNQNGRCEGPFDRVMPATNTRSQQQHRNRSRGGHGR